MCVQSDGTAEQTAYLPSEEADRASIDPVQLVPALADLSTLLLDLPCGQGAIDPTWTADVSC